MTDVQDLIARLRGFCPNPYSGKEAADSLEALAEANERLTRERDTLRDACNQARLAFAGVVSSQSAIDKLDALGDKPCP